MADFNSLKKFAAEKMSAIASKTMEVAKTTADITKTAAKVTKLKADLASDKNELQKNFALLGQLFYENNNEDAPEGYEDIFAEITVGLGVIQSKEEEIDALQNCEESGKELFEDLKDKASDAYDIVKEKAIDLYGDIRDKLDGDDDDVEVEIIEEAPIEVVPAEEEAPASDEE